VGAYPETAAFDRKIKEDGIYEGDEISLAF
jgi:hypothetical protein